MEPQLKERLIGAAVLVALGVWLIPWILDGPVPEATERSAALELPAPEETPAMRVETIDLEARRAPESAPELGAAEPSTVVSEPPAQPPRNERVPTAAAAPSPRVADPEPAARARAREPERAQATGDWAVQLGSFGERENAERLAKRVATFGAEPEVSTTRSAGRVMYRVRVGPHASRELADAAASSLTAHGFVAQVVTVD